MVRFLTALFTCLVLVMFWSSTHASVLRQSSVMVCEAENPCAWEVYSLYTKLPQEFQLSPCTCPEELECKRCEDDITQKVYVWYCRSPDYPQLPVDYQHPGSWNSRSK